MPRDVRQLIDVEALEAVFRYTTDGVLIIDRRRKATAINPAAEEMTGWSTRDLSMLSCAVFDCRNERGERMCEEQCQCLRAQETAQVQGPMYMRLAKATGGHVDVEATLVPVLTSDGRMSSTAMVLRDVTQLEQYDQQVQDLNDDITEKVLVLRSLSEGLTGGWKIPLVNIRTAGTHMQSRYGSTLGEGVRYVQRILASAQELEQLFAKLQAQARTGLLQRRRAPDSSSSSSS